MQKVITDDLDALLGILPPSIRQKLQEQEDFKQLIEVILDLGRPPEARFLNREAGGSNLGRRHGQGQLAEVEPRVGKGLRIPGLKSLDGRMVRQSFKDRLLARERRGLSRHP